jgi:hypothetical protein
VSTATKVIPQPLNGMEIRKGIAVRMTQGLPPDVAESLREQIVAGLGKTCSLMPSSAYAKFKATWTMAWWRDANEVCADWWVSGTLDDFGRVTPFGIGEHRIAPDGTVWATGVIEEVPPDRFRRETDQPIPKPTELKPPEPEKSSFSRSARGAGKRRQV